MNHALILGDKVFVTWPMYVQRYGLSGKKAVADWPDAKMMKEALDEMSRFYVRTGPSRATALAR
jgi:hypothetical protein